MASTQRGGTELSVGDRTLLLLGVAGVLHALSYHGCGPLDDDFIVYRYARNWLDGLGLVFNPGERVEGFSAPLWVLVVAGGLACGLPPTLTSLLASLAGMLAAVCATGLAWRRLAPGTRWFPPALLLAASPALAWHTQAGLGTTALAGLLAVWLWCWLAAVQDRRPPLGAAAALGLAGLMRAEALLFALPFVVAERGRGHARTAALSFAPALAWIAFRLAYYRRLLPNTYYAKKLPPVDDLGYGLTYLGLGTLATGIGICALLALPLLRGRREPTARALAAATCGVLAHTAYVVWVGGDFIPLARYFLPALPVALVAGCAGFQRLVGRRPRVLTAAFLLALAAYQWPQVVESRAELRRRQAAFVARWTRVAGVIARDAGPRARAATSAIGVFGWASELELIDMLGLTNTELQRRAPDLRIVEKGHQRHDAAWVLGQRPEFVVPAYTWTEGEGGEVPLLVVSAWERDLWLHPDLEAEYRLAALETEGERPILFHVRRDVRVPPPAREVRLPDLGRLVERP